MVAGCEGPASAPSQSRIPHTASVQPPQPVVARTDDSEMAVTIGADGFSYTRPGEDSMPDYKKGEYKLGHQL